MTPQEQEIAKLRTALHARITEVALMGQTRFSGAFQCEGHIIDATAAMLGGLGFERDRSLEGYHTSKIYQLCFKKGAAKAEMFSSEKAELRHIKDEVTHTYRELENLHAEMVDAIHRYDNARYDTIRALSRLFEDFEKLRESVVEKLEGRGADSEAEKAAWTELEMSDELDELAAMWEEPLKTEPEDLPDVPEWDWFEEDTTLHGYRLP